MIKLKRMKKYEQEHDYEYGDWIIEACGGFSMVRHFYATNKKTGIWFYQFTLRETKEWIEKIENNPNEIDNMYDFFRKPAYI